MEAVLSEITVRQILELAINKEIESQQLYANLGMVVEDPSVKDTFNELKEQEMAHQKLLEQYYRGERIEGALSNADVLDYRLAEQLDAPLISPYMDMKDTFMLAARREKISHEFYLGLAAAHPDGEAKRLLNKLARQELGHKHRMEFLYTEVSFPQTNGG